jgi:hypothetical protein
LKKTPPFVEPKVHYHAHKGPSLISIRIQMNSDHILTHSSRNIHFNIIALSTLRSCKLSLPSGFQIKVLQTFIFHLRATCPAHVVFLDFNILIVFGEECKL